MKLEDAWNDHREENEIPIIRFLLIRVMVS
jgi:hypothetical protein